ncbi:hypothetical protein GCM10011581_05880 [Saccharopolyspora subtropica]|uniref:Uncharacterized protein n=1 Tax=Saccharopolyspora thermophila TaxID=89367 RepID=A0A917N6R9_9PSEU|nr:hypothetical protein [Saccharopolyspora subtropica]GGI71703.1 hypothetical protein GCM10011581_05880 [Saccharopolyspora subtropica]
MKTALGWAGSRLVELLVLVVLPMLLLVLLVVGRFAVVTVLPVLLLVGVGAVLRLVMVGVDRLAELAPAPRLGVSGR